jgi:hypothetical protein
VVAGAGAGGEPELPDTTPPEIVSVSPVDGAVAVRSDANIVVTFSESMDEAQTEMSFQSEELTPEAIEISWSDHGSVMTVHPKARLVVPLGSTRSPEYHFSITTSASDVAGNHLLENREFSFATRLPQIGRALLTDIEAIGEGSAGSTQKCAGNADDLQIGDLDDNRGVGLVLTFDWTVLASRVTDGDWVGAQLFLAPMTAVDGLGSLMAYQVSSPPDAVSWATAQLSAITPNPDSSFDVSAALLDDIVHATERGGLTQYMVRFAQSTNGNGVADLLSPNCSDIELNVIYTSP